MKPALFLLPLVTLCFPAPAGAAGDSAKGAAVFRTCGACHTATEPVNRVGPSLQGIFGRPVGSVEGYRYSDAMTAFGAGKVWDEALLSQYLLAPRLTVPGTKMAFAGLKKPGDIADLIAYLVEAGRP
ncbi:c-type cytochrome [Ensifer soli]|uniref:c-type cytochrome n=1 Tax=Ciceribacter sp. sgz301302 TaxID=3342379 RepID=UPI0035B79DE8